MHWKYIVLLLWLEIFPVLDVKFRVDYFNREKLI